MRGFVPNYSMVSPKNLSEALSLLEKNPSLKPFAGGTDIMVLFEAGKLEAKEFLDINQLSELKKIKVEPQHIEIGALATYTDIAQNPEIQKEFPMLVQAATLTGAVAIQNRGTIGGNIANSSPAADTPPALLAYDAALILTSSKGERQISISQFFKAYKKTALEKGDLITKVILKRNFQPTDVHYYHKVGTRKAQAISKVCFAAFANMENQKILNVRIGLGSVGPTSQRALQTEALLKGQVVNDSLIQKARASLAQEIVPIDDIRSDSAYRLDVACNLLEDFLHGLARRPS
ncbi:MAG: xanthine dehydrogenase family protein subunit M [Bdellovibrionales bacterium]